MWFTYGFGNPRRQLWGASQWDVRKVKGRRSHSPKVGNPTRTWSNSCGGPGWAGGGHAVPGLMVVLRQLRESPYPQVGDCVRTEARRMYRRNRRRSDPSRQSGEPRASEPFVQELVLCLVEVLQQRCLSRRASRGAKTSDSSNPALLFKKPCRRVASHKVRRTRPRNLACIPIAVQPSPTHSGTPQTAVLDDTCGNHPTQSDGELPVLVGRRTQPIGTRSRTI